MRFKGETIGLSLSKPLKGAHGSAKIRLDGEMVADLPLGEKPQNYLIKENLDPGKEHELIIFRNHYPDSVKYPVIGKLQPNGRPETGEHAVRSSYQLPLSTCPGR